MYGTVDELKLTIGFQAGAMEKGKEEGQFDEELETVLENVSEMIDGMIVSRVDPARVSENAVLKRIALAIARFDAYSQYARNEVPETIREDKKEAMKMLENIQTGKISLAFDTPVTGEPTKVEPSWTEKTQVFGNVMM